MRRMLYIYIYIYIELCASLVSVYSRVSVCKYVRLFWANDNVSNNSCVANVVVRAWIHEFQDKKYRYFVDDNNDEDDDYKDDKTTE